MVWDKLTCRRMPPYAVTGYAMMLFCLYTAWRYMIIFVLASLYRQRAIFVKQATLARKKKGVLGVHFVVLVFITCSTLITLFSFTYLMSKNSNYPVYMPSPAQRSQHASYMTSQAPAEGLTAVFYRHDFRNEEELIYAINMWLASNPTFGNIMCDLDMSTKLFWLFVNRYRLDSVTFRYDVLPGENKYQYGLVELQHFGLYRKDSKKMLAEWQAFYPDAIVLQKGGGSHSYGSRSQLAFGGIGATNRVQLYVFFKYPRNASIQHATAPPNAYLNAPAPVTQPSFPVTGLPPAQPPSASLGMLPTQPPTQPPPTQPPPVNANAPAPQWQPANGGLQNTNIATAPTAANAAVPAQRQLIFCSTCGFKLLKENAAFCSHCGARTG